MTRAELVKKSEELQRSAKLGLLPLLVYVVLLAVFLWWANFHKDIFPEHVAEAVFIIGFVGIYVILLISTFFSKKRRQQLGFRCPQCKKELFGRSLEIAIASGRCGCCGAIVLEDWNK
jgi:hypothetical protein